METLRLRDFDLEIGPGDGSNYPVAVLNSPSGQARATMAFPFADPDALSAELAAIENAVLGAGGAAANQRVQNFGARLFHALFTGEVRTVYDRSQQATSAAGEGLRIKLRVNASELATVPWEFLFDPRPAEFVALSRHTPIVRYLELPLGEPDLAVKPPIRVLGLVANPTGVAALDIEREKARVAEALQPLGNKVELVWLPGQTIQDLQTALQGGPWHVFHFVGHAAADGGSGEGVLLLADEQGKPDPLSATQLGRLLADQRSLRLAVLNACQGAKGNEQSLFSSLAAGLVRRGLPAVLAMQYDISDRAAVEFTGSFYSALAANLPIDAATSEGRKAIAALESAEWGTPLLIMRAPDGVIWDVREPRKLPLAAIGAAAAGAIVVIALLAFIAFQVRPAPIQPMTGAFNIAVADFGEIDPASGAVKSTRAASAASQFLFDGLQRQLTASEQTIPVVRDIQVRHDKTTPLIKGSTAAEQEANAAALAKALNAHILIYGNVLAEQNGSDLQVGFYVSPQASEKEFNALLGTQALGGQVSLPASFDGSGSLTNITVSEQLDLRSRIIFWLTVAMTQDLLGKSDQALATLQDAEQALQDWQESDGKELLYFLQGREHLFLDQVADARTAFARAASINPSYARAEVALGSVDALVSNRQEQDAARIADDSALRQAIDAQQRAMAEAEGAGDSFTAALAKAALAQSLDVLCISYVNLGQLEQAANACTDALNYADDAVAYFMDSQENRLYGQALLSQGLAHFGMNYVNDANGARDQALADLNAAIAAFTQCIAQGELAPFDKVLQEKVIAAACQPGLAQVQGRLAQLQEN